jgi:acetylornithine/N-succinyldiaminopimelate aminotransferase
VTGVQTCALPIFLLLFDEIQTGWCRTGEIMAFMHYGIKPDILTMAKAMGGGMPIGAVCATSEVASAFSMGAHGTTYGGNPVCCAASLAQITELLDHNLAGNAKEIGGYFMEKLKAIPHVKDVRGKGLLVAVEFEREIGAEVKQACFDRQLLVTAIGTSIIRMVPPLILSREHCDQAVAIIKEAVETIYAEQ